MDRRRSPRVRTRFDALISSGTEEGAGQLSELSYAGAKLEHTSLQPPIGTRVTLYLFVQPISPFVIEGQVARHTETGFAVAYELFDPEIRRLVDDVNALVVELPGA
jgi:PilZ domain